MGGVGLEMVGEIREVHGGMRSVCFGRSDYDGKKRVRYGMKNLNFEGRISDRMKEKVNDCLLYTSPSPRDKRQSRMPSSA